MRTTVGRFAVLPLLLAPVAAPAQAPPAAAKDRPNILFVLTDDQRFDAVGCVGTQPVKTPAMDRVAVEGVRFRNAFVTTSLCSPSRASFLTGEYASRHGVRDNHTDLPDAHLTLPQLLQKSGYATAYCGKWHMGNQRSDRRPGFEFWASFKGQGVYENPTIEVNSSAGPGQGGKEIKAEGWMDAIMTDHALRFLRQDRGGKPFYLQVCYKSCHAPCIPPPSLRDRYADVKFPISPGVWDDLAGKPSFLNPGGRPSANREEREKNIQATCRKYHATLAGADEQLGRLLDFLDKNGLAGNTIVVFAGDNGYFHGEHGRGDKRLLYEESLRIPLFVRFPKSVKAGRVLDPMVLNVDFAPTVLDYAGVVIPSSMQGKSLRPLLEGGPSDAPPGRPVDWRSSFYCEYFVDEPTSPLPRLEGVRTADRIYMRSVDTSPVEEELYDLAKDPYEMKNLVADPAAKEPLEKLKAELERYRKEIGAPGTLPGATEPKARRRKVR